MQLNKFIISRLVMQNNSINFIRLLITIISFITIFPISTQAQLEWNNWIVKSYLNPNNNDYLKYINTYYNYDFTTKNELSLVDTITLNYKVEDYYKLPERLSSISEKKTGKLLFYSNNWNILDSNHKEIKNGDLKNASEVYYYDNKGYRFTTNLIIPSSKEDIYSIFYLADKNNKKGLFYNLIKHCNKIWIMSMEIAIFHILS